MAGRRRYLPRGQRDGLTSAGWLDLDNARTWIKADHREIEVVGPDDPHIRRDRYAEVAGPADTTADLSLGVVHAPYRRVLDPIGRRRSSWRWRWDLNPRRGLPSHAFEACSFGRSDTPPPERLQAPLSAEERA